jgi:hypothetical protein
MGKGEWMSFAKAVARAGTLDALLVPVREERIFARGLWPGGAAKHIFAGTWWDERIVHDIDPVAGRAKFWTSLTPGFTIAKVAIGIEFERAAVEARWPVKPKPPGRKGGKKPSPVWQQIFKHFDDVVAHKGKFRNVGSATTSVENWLEKNNKRLSRSAIERGIPKYRPDWIAA